MRMSIPSTCTEQHKQKRQKIYKKPRTINHECEDLLHKAQYLQLINRIQFTVNDVHLRNICQQSVLNICALYSVSESSPVMQGLQELSQNPQVPHHTLLALFFILFNLDTTLKQQMIDVETAVVQRKIGHFSIHLREKLIPEYMAVENTPAIVLSTKCVDSWSVS